MFTWPMPFVEKLAQDRPVVIFDNRGTGRSQGLKENVELRIHHFAEDLQSLIEHLSYSKVNLFGYSMGGCISLEFAKLFPEQAEKIVLQSTSAGGALYTGSDPDVKERLANPRGSTFEEMFFDFFDLCMPQSAIEEFRPLLKEICQNARPYPTPPRVLMPQLMAFRHFDASNYLGEIKNETLLFHGQSDRVLKVQNGQKLAENLTACTPVFLEQCGHCPHIEHEGTVQDKVRSFLQESQE